MSTDLRTDEFGCYRLLIHDVVCQAYYYEYVPWHYLATYLLTRVQSHRSVVEVKVKYFPTEKNAVEYLESRGKEMVTKYLPF